MDELETGYSRLPQVLNRFQIGKTTWWNGVKNGNYPKSVKISTNVTAWRNKDLAELERKLNEQAGLTD